MLHLSLSTEMLHLSTEKYNNEQVTKVFDEISAETCRKTDYFDR